MLGAKGLNCGLLLTLSGLPLIHHTLWSVVRNTLCTGEAAQLSTDPPMTDYYLHLNV